MEMTAQQTLRRHKAACQFCQGVIPTQARERLADVFKPHPPGSCGRQRPVHLCCIGS